MSVEWKLKQYLAKKHAIYSATEFKKIITSRTGIVISLQNLCNYINTTPKMIRLETVVIICSALRCKLSDFCQVTPDHKKKRDNEKLSYKNTPLSKRGVHQFPNPQDYRQ
jgi:DNA-binding Xre family transcriptional regulator